jgi:thioredoxin reductase
LYLLAAIVQWSPLRMPSESTYDCIIIGGGPAGLTCAIFLARYRRPVLVIDSGKPRNYASRAIHGFLGQHNIAPGELLARGRSEAEAAGAEICHCTASRVEQIGDIFEVTTTAGTMRARRVVLAYGVRDTLPDIPDIESYYGGSVFHCADCDGYEVSEKRVGVIGWGKKAVGLALKLLQWTEQLTIFTDGHPREWTDEHHSKLLALGIGVKDEKVISLVGENAMVRAAVLSTGERVSVDALFFTIGVERSCLLAEDLGCEVDDKRPNIIVDDHKKTSVEGIYAIGDLVPGSQLAITSAADGAIAAIAINKSLLPPSRLV